MDMKKGYKQTEIGEIPEDWEIHEFGEITEEIVGGGTPSRSNPKFWGHEIPWVTVKDFATYNSMETQEYITKEGLRNSASHLIPMGVIITSTRMALGKAVIYDVDVSINQDLKAIFPSKNIFTRFLYYWFQFKAKYIENLGSGSTVMGLSLPDLKKIKIKLPPLPEQQAIAEVLTDTDNLIQALEKQIVKKRLIKQGVMQELLTPKEGWEVKKLGEVAFVNMGQSPLSAYYNSEGIGLPLVQGNADVENRKTIIRFYTSMITKRGKMGDIIMSVRAPVGEISKATFECCLGRGVCSITYDNDYLYHYLIYFEKSWAKLSTGSTFDSVNSKQVKDLGIPIPKSKAEQLRIAMILSNMDSEINALGFKLEKYRKAKQGMMQNLLTGKIRLI
jgi:type I restriction enzyme S subunit